MVINFGLYGKGFWSKNQWAFANNAVRTAFDIQILSIPERMLGCIAWLEFSSLKPVTQFIQRLVNLQRIQHFLHRSLMKKR